MDGILGNTNIKGAWYWKWNHKVCSKKKKPRVFDAIEADT